MDDRTEPDEPQTVYSPQPVERPGAPVMKRGAAKSVPAEPAAPEPDESFEPTDSDTASAAPLTDSSAGRSGDAASESKRRVEYMRSVRGNRPQKSHKIRNTIIVIVILLLLAGAAVYYWLELRDHSQPTTKSTTTSQQPVGQPKSQQPAAEQLFSDQTKPYTSNNFNLSLNYPADWTPAETPDQLTITSPTVQLTDAGGQAVNGRAVLTIRPKNTQMQNFAKGNAVAVLTSQRVKYANPSGNQRGATYLSFLQYATTTTKGGLDGIYITGDSGYQKGQAIPKADVAKVDPLITLSFVQCADADCAAKGQTPLTIASTMWTDQSTNFQTALTKLLTSLSIQ